MTTVQRRVERLEAQAGGQADDSPSIVLVLGDGTYHAGGRRWTQEEFERRWPDASVTRCHGFDGVVFPVSGIDLENDI